jgi:hypothetical protein
LRLDDVLRRRHGGRRIDQAQVHHARLGRNPGLRVQRAAQDDEQSEMQKQSHDKGEQEAMPRSTIARTPRSRRNHALGESSDEGDVGVRGFGCNVRVFY